ncbi:helicase carboxy-terminal domain protein (macronuclear) [Tetrahymena thermophila SB210]|uniref:Helicase carboxy-terminal domain protein n=1 Tax=Tetrahymena thermophila (strain SB210) TaxID=312017 RepID=Q22C20_TETTS|nr:helicase carboxy-terminal domain protein [Tetrahymena thermophila SB210]EAR82842.2 helicase carboxy-terminal domain protein [Tetrahymena thermophila SB210]|eukprot:XP_001030505.2 helicase carboxy-terminal domain protein [Tetrahymena thermophila SB210]
MYFQQFQKGGYGNFNRQNSSNYNYNNNNNNVDKKQITIQLVQDNTILISGSYTSFTEQRKDIIKKLGGSWDNDRKGWRCQYSQYNLIKQNIEKTGVEIQGIPDFVNSAIKSINEKLTFQTDKKQYEILYNPEDINKKIENELPQKTVTNLYNFQKQGVQFGLKNNGRVLIADEMGVGKTIQAICLASCYKSAWPLLIICPSSLKYNWKEEIVKWAYPPLKEMQVQILSKQAEEIYIMTRVLIVSYDLAPKVEEKIKRFKTNIVIADEAHYLKNAQAKRTNSLLPILQKIKHVILLTGTPAFARPKEMFTLLSIIRPDIFKTFKSFGDRYCDPKPARFGGGIDYTGSTNEKELFYILKKTIMIRRLKQDVLSQLPSKRRKKVHVNVDPKILSEIQAILNQTNKSSLEQLFEQAQKQNESSNEEQNGSSSMFSALSLCYQLSGQAKLHELKNYIKDLLENDIKIIVFAHHNEMLNQLENFVQNELQLKFIRIDGKVAPKERHERVQQFQTDPQVKVAILSLLAASTGLTLTASSNIVFAEMNWTPAIMQQAEDRAHRIGQENSVLCHYILGEKTLDDLLYKKIEQKIAIVSNILDGESKALKIDEVQKAENENQIMGDDNNQYIEEDIEDSANGTQMTQQRQMTQAQFLQQLIQEKENRKIQSSQISEQISNAESTVNQNQVEQVLKPLNIQVNNNQQSESENSDDDEEEELFILKMIAAQSAKSLKEKQNNIEKNSVISDNNQNNEKFNQMSEKTSIQKEQNDKQIPILAEINEKIQIEDDEAVINEYQIKISEECKIQKNVIPQKESKIQCNDNKYNILISSIEDSNINHEQIDDYIYDDNQNLSIEQITLSVDKLNSTEKKAQQNLSTNSINNNIQKLQNNNLNTMKNNQNPQDLETFNEFLFSSSSKKQSNIFQKKSETKNNVEKEQQANKINKQTPKDNKIIPKTDEQISTNKVDSINKYQSDEFFYDDEDYFNSIKQDIKTNSIDLYNSQSKQKNPSVNLTQKQKQFLRAENYQKGIKKIIFDNGDVEYVSSSEDLEQFYSNKLESNVQKIISNKQEEPKCDYDSDDELFSYLDQNFSSKQESNKELSYSKSNSDIQQPTTRNVRKREDFEQDFVDRNGISEQDCNQVFNQFQPQKQSSISKKSLLKLAKQHF